MRRTLHKSQAGAAMKVGAAAAMMAVTSGLAQEALQNNIAVNGTLNAMRQPGAGDLGGYTIKEGDFKLLAQASLDGEWNDNVTLQKTGASGDFVVEPSVQLTSSYPLSEMNVLRLQLGVGYMDYLRHSELSSLEVSSGSTLAFDFAVKSFLFDVHDQFTYSQTSSDEPAIAGTGEYGTYQNRVGASVGWNVGKIALNLGYDHLNLGSTSSGAFEAQDRTSDFVTMLAGWKFDPRLTAGVEGSAGFTTYDQDTLNNSQDYSGGVYATWTPSKRLSVTARGGYVADLFQQSSDVTPAQNLHSWYFDLRGTQQLTEFLSYSFTAGRQVRPGVETDDIQDYYVNGAIADKLMKSIDLTGDISYEHGQQGAGFGDFGGEVYDYVKAGLLVAYQIRKNFTSSLGYHHVLRSSSNATLGYNQDVVTLRLTYLFE